MPPTVVFHRIIEQTRLPQRADRTAAGTLPIRAARYCEAITTACAFGWYLFPPLDLELAWDGHDIAWSWPGHDAFIPLTAAQFPGLGARFDAAAPPEARGCAPPMLTALPEPGTLQIWTGLFARTAPDWSLLLRPLPNFPRSGGFELYEGVVETDRWFGPLFVNLRLTRTHHPVHLKADFPFAQAQPLPRIAYADPTVDSMQATAALADLSSQDWSDYVATVVTPNADPDRPHGRYATAARRRSARE